MPLAMKKGPQRAITKLHRILGEKIALISCEGKKPTKRGWNKLTFADMTPAYLARLSGSNIGVICGVNSGNLCALDIDDDEFLRSFLAAVPEARGWPRVRGQRGAKLFLLVDGCYPPTHNLFKAGKGWGEWRGNGANCVVWGNHPETRLPYNWDVTGSPSHVTFDVLATALHKLGITERGTTTSRPRQLPQQTPNTSSSASYNLHPVSCALYDNRHNSDVATRIKARIEMRRAIEKEYGRLQGLYERLIEPRFDAAAGQRNGFLVEAIPFLIRCVAPEIAVRLATHFYDANKRLFKDSRESHERQAWTMVKGVEQTYLGELSDREREIFTVLPTREQSAFRICRDLALLPTPARPSLTFFLSCGELAARLHVDDRQAHRLLRTFTSDDILKRLEVGLRWRPGVRPKASTFRWMLPISVKKRQ